MHRTGLAAGRYQSMLDETQLNKIATGVGAGSDKTEVGETAASVGPRSTPAPLKTPYLTVQGSAVYEEVL